MAMQIRKDPGAFRLTKGQKRPRQTREDHLAFIRGLPCLVCLDAGLRRFGCDPAHVRYADERYGKQQTGAGIKPNDQWVVPLCREHHDNQHDWGDEREWWSHRGIDPLQAAVRLYAVSGDHEAGLLVLQWMVSP